MRRLVVPIILAGLLVAACAAGTSPISNPTASPTPALATPIAATATPTLTPTPTPTPAATVAVAPTAAIYGPVSVFWGVENCDLTAVMGTMTGAGTTVQHSRNGTAECIDTVNDPRMNGTVTSTWNMDYWGTPDQSNGALVQWGTGRLVNAGGAWDGRATGVYSTGTGDTIFWWFTGTGGYAGLAAFDVITGSGPWTIHGQIFPGSPPKP
jgi:hypothetical protein